MKICLVGLFLLSQLAFADVPADSNRSSVMENARRQMLRSMVQPGWGQWDNGHPVKAALFTGTEVALLWGIATQHNRWQRFSRDMQTASEAEKSQLASRAAFYLRDRNKLLWWLLWFELINMTDAYVDAALIDFDGSPDLGIQLDRDRFLCTFSFSLGP